MCNVRKQKQYRIKLEHVMYLSCDNNDLEQLQDQFIRLAALGMIFIAGTHEEVFQLPAKGILFLVRVKPMTCRRFRTMLVVVAVAMIVTLMDMFTAAVCKAVLSH